jgi:hypothetical protein
MQFYNSDLGLPYTPKGSKVTVADLDLLVGSWTAPASSTRPCIAGVDVGSVIHVRVNEILPDGSERAVYFGELREVEDLEEICRRFNVVSGVIDAMPEIRLSRRVSRWKGWLRCEFHSSKAADKVDLLTRKVSVNRTEILDAVKQKVTERRFSLPRNAASLPDYYEQMQALTRVYNEARMEYEWIGSDKDHYMLAEAYLELARRVINSVR